MNRFLQDIHKEKIIIYIKYDNIYIVDNNVYILRSLLNFKYYNKNGRKIIFINKNYLNYVLKALRENYISYVVIDCNCGYSKLLEYNSINNHYSIYYEKGKRLIKNENKVDKLLFVLKKRNDINVLLNILEVVCVD